MLPPSVGLFVLMREVEWSVFADIICEFDSEHSTVASIVLMRHVRVMQLLPFIQLEVGQSFWVILLDLVLDESSHVLEKIRISPSE